MKKLIKTLLVVFLLSLNNPLKAEDLFFESSIDLNGDNQLEEVNLKNIEGTCEFCLEISDQKIGDEFYDEVSDGFMIIDINKYDKYKEIAVHSPGPSSDDEYFVYWYDGKVIKEMAHLARWPKFLGNGIVYVDGWADFWYRRDKYVLNNSTRELEHVPQFAYYVGVEVTVKKSFPIYKEKDLKQKVALLSKDSKTELLLCDLEDREWNDYLYLIKSKSGLIGWARYQEIYENSEGFPFAD